jgi:NhaA family Na+:H+ antiporter
MANLDSANAVSTGPPGSWWPARRLARRALAPVEKFLAVEAASGVLLLVAAAVALIWANSPWRESYGALWHTPIGGRVAHFAFERPLHFWINDGLMTIFFFVVGLEIRREIHHGELSDLRRAALPLAAALGGMLVPAVLFAAINRGQASSQGWGIPMATDIAFAVGVLTLLGDRVPSSLRILLLALAVIDDVGAILVIAVFYSTGVSASGFVVLGAGIFVILLMQMLGVRRPWAYVPAGVVAWAGAYAAGIHPTLAGVVVGLLTPVRAWLGPQAFLERADESVAAVRDNDILDERELLPLLDSLNRARQEAVSPVERLQHGLHGWVAFGIMPLFALANAGVSLEGAAFTGDAVLAFSGVTIGLLFGKPLGVFAASWLAVRFGIAALPRGVSWRELLLVGVVAGIGFTMSIFIAQLAFGSGPRLEAAKLGVLLASAMAAAIAYGFGRSIWRAAPSGEAEEVDPRTDAEA